MLFKDSDIIYYYITDWVPISTKSIPGNKFKLFYQKNKKYNLNKTKGLDFF